MKINKKLVFLLTLYLAFFLPILLSNSTLYYERIGIKLSEYFFNISHKYTLSDTYERTNMTNLTKVKLTKIADSYEKDFFDHFPEQGLFWGKTDVALDRFADHSLSALKHWRVKEEQFLQQLNQLPVADLIDSPEHITYLLLKEYLENNIADRLAKNELWDVDPLDGWHNKLTMIAEKQPVDTLAYQNLAIARWKTVHKIVEQEIENLSLGLKSGYTAPKPAVERVIKQFHLLTSTPVTDSPFFECAKNSDNEEFKKQFSQIIEKEIYPALTRYLSFLEKDYLPLARKEIGLSFLPNGKACYQAKIKKETTLDISPEDVYHYGLQYMDQLINEIMTIGQKEFGTRDLVEIFNQAKSNPKYLFHSEQEILAYNESALERAIKESPLWFDMMPKAKGVLKPYPLHRAKTGAAGEYHPPSLDGTRPGIFYINTFEPEKRSRVDQEATLFHELIPGHHFQIALAQEDKNQHSVNQYLWNCGYGEGWALYVERLADNMGLYSDDISRLGMLSNEALRAARLVVDPGIHYMNWSRQDAINYLKKHTALKEETIESEVDRYIMMPGQATSYMLGKREIEQLQKLSKETLGDKFTYPEFHNQVLKNGTVTLPMLKEQILEWIAAANK